MKLNYLNEMLSEIFGNKIQLMMLKNQNAKSWYEREYIRYSDSDFEPGKIYGVYFNGYVQYQFSVKSIDNLMKSFFTNYINKYLSKETEFINGEFVEIGKEAAKNRILHRISTERLAKYLMYSTNYGIGIWVMLVPQNEVQANKNLVEKLLSSKNIEFKNEYSDAGWVYRYILKGNYLDHNQLISEL